MKKLFYLFLISIFSFSCSLFQYPTDPEPSLKLAYRNNDTIMLKGILDKWASEYKPISEERFSKMLPVEKYTYEIYEDIFNPYKLNLLFNSEKEIDSNSAKEYENYLRETKYFLIPDEIHTAVYDSICRVGNYLGGKELISSFNLTYFFPRVNFSNVKIISLKHSIKKELNDFIDYGETYIYPEKRIKIREKLNFLNKYLNIYSGHSVKIETRPTIHIHFEESYSEAILKWSAGDSGGDAVYRRTNNKWKLIHSRVGWII